MPTPRSPRPARANVGQRLARWLLMVHDRVDGDEIPLTRDFLALMVGVRRPAVSLGLREFERRGWVVRRRGVVTLRDRRAVLCEAGGFYGVAEAELFRVFGGGMLDLGTGRRTTR